MSCARCDARAAVEAVEKLYELLKPIVETWKEADEALACAEEMVGAVWQHIGHSDDSACEGPICFTPVKDCWGSYECYLKDKAKEEAVKL